MFFFTISSVIYRLNGRRLDWRLCCFDLKFTILLSAAGEEETQIEANDPVAATWSADLKLH